MQCIPCHQLACSSPCQQVASNLLITIDRGEWQALPWPQIWSGRRQCSLGIQPWSCSHCINLAILDHFVILCKYIFIVIETINKILNTFYSFNFSADEKWQENKTFSNWGSLFGRKFICHRDICEFHEKWCRESHTLNFVCKWTFSHIYYIFVQLW